MILFERLLLAVFSLFLFGCAANIPEKLGISDLEWENYSQSKQKILLANYKLMMSEREKPREKQDPNKTLSNTFLEVRIYDGKVMFPPSFVNWQSYQPVSFSIFQGECRNIVVKESKEGDVKTELGVCFYGNILHLDSSRYDITKKAGSTNIYYSPLWLHGFTYQGINSSGYVRLNGVTVKIKQKNTVVFESN